jgi:hypothetical protein
MVEPTVPNQGLDNARKTSVFAGALIVLYALPANEPEELSLLLIHAVAVEILGLLHVQLGHGVAQLGPLGLGVLRALEDLARGLEEARLGGALRLEQRRRHGAREEGLDAADEAVEDVRVGVDGMEGLDAVPAQAEEAAAAVGGDGLALVEDDIAEEEVLHVFELAKVTKDVLALLAQLGDALGVLLEEGKDKLGDDHGCCCLQVAEACSWVSKDKEGCFMLALWF